MAGKIKYMPRIVIEELNDLKVEHKINEDCKAMEKMVEYTRVGREVERMMTFNFKHRPTKLRRRFI